MIRAVFTLALLSAMALGCGAQTNQLSVVDQPWYEARTTHFNIHSYGPARNVFALAARLEQFSEAYASLAGTSTVPSSPITVFAFPDEQSLSLFVPLYRNRPVSLAGFFKRAPDENLIVLGLSGTNTPVQALDVIFHEYTHFLFRHNQRVWPLWLHEGMAEIYGSFAVSGRTAVIGRPLLHYVQLLSREQMMPLEQLFQVTHDSPHYNESERQGPFYAQSWLLTHYLMAGDSPEIRKRFARFTPLLQAGQSPEQAFTNALGVSLPAMERLLRAYVSKGVFQPIRLALSSDFSSPKPLTTRALTPVEKHYRLGKVLIAVNRLDSAQTLFSRAATLAPKSPLPPEGLALVAIERDRRDEAWRHLQSALEQRSTSFLVHYHFANEKYRRAAAEGERYAALNETAAEEIRRDLQKAISLNPNFAPAQHLLGFFETVQGNLNAAEQHLRTAIRLEPDNLSYLFSLAQAQMRREDYDAARRTLLPLLRPQVDPKIRKTAEAFISEIPAKRGN